MKANTPLEQIMLNTREIEKLKQDIAPLYACGVDLGTTSESVSVSDTNLLTDIEKGFLMDIKGDIYKLMGFNTDKTTAYIEYYATIYGQQGEQGEQGEQGADGQNGADGRNGNNIYYYSQTINSTTINEQYIYNPTSQELQIGDVIFDSVWNCAVITSIENDTITVTLKISSIIDDTTNALNKVWSGNKSFKYADKGAFYTKTAPTESGGIITLATADIENPAPNITDTLIKVNDIVLYVDSNDKVKELYKIANVTASTLTLNKIGEFGGGKQLYQHNCLLYGDLISQGNPAYIYITIFNENPNEMVRDDLRDFLINNGFDGSSNSKVYNNVDIYISYVGLSSHELKGIAWNGTRYCSVQVPSGVTRDYINTTFVDKVINL